MRVKELTSVPRSVLNAVALDEKKNMGDSGHGFQRHMSDINAAEYDRYIKDLTGKIQRQGELIGQKMDLAEFQKYRELIMELFNETASNSYRFLKAEKFDAKGRHKVFAIIKRVNHRLEELAEEILRQENENLTALGIMDDIRGMLVDLFM